MMLPTGKPLSLLRIAVFAGAFLLSPGWALSVLAEPPMRVSAPFDDMTGQFCDDFPVLIHALVNKEVLTLFSDGRIHLTGGFKAEVTNLTTQKTIVVNASGPFKISSDGQTIVGEGRGILFGEAGFFGPGAPAELSIQSGRVEFSAVDFPFILSRTGHTEDLCAELAEP
jgi:hypothetical protein